MTVLLALAASQAGCAYIIGGAAGVYFLLEEDEKQPPPAPPVNYLPTASGTSPSGTYPAVVAVSYSLFDANGDSANIDAQFTPDSGTSWYSMLEYTGGGSTSEGTSNLSATSSGSAHSFEWNSSADPNVTAYNSTVQIRITPREAGGTAGTAWTSGTFTVKYNAVPQAAVNMPSGLLRLDIPITYHLTDPESNQASIAVHYSTSGPPYSFSTATGAAGGDGVTGLSTSPNAPGSFHTFTWDSGADLGNQDSQVWIRVAPADMVSGLQGLSSVAGPFWVSNDVMTVVIGTGSYDLSRPYTTALDASGNVYIADTYHAQIKVLNTQASVITVAGVSIDPGGLASIAGTGIPGYNGDNKHGLEAQLNMPSGVAVAQATGDVYVADTGNHRIRRIDAGSGYITTIAGNGTAGTTDNVLATNGQLSSPIGVALDSSSPPNAYIADTGNHSLRCVNQGAINLPVGNTIVIPGAIRVFSGLLGFQGTVDNTLSLSARWTQPCGIALNSLKHVFVCDTGNNWIRAMNNNSGSALTIGNVSIANNTVRKIAGPDGVTTPGFAGDGLSAVDASMRMNSPYGIALSGGGHVFFTDMNNQRIRAINTNSPGGGSIFIGIVTISEGSVDTISGDGFPGTADNVTALSARYLYPRGISVDSIANRIFLADTSNDLLRCFNTQGTAATVAGVSISAGYVRSIKGTSGGIVLANPRGIAVVGNMIYVADGQNGHRVVGYNLATGTIAAVAGDGVQGYVDNCAALQARFDGPTDVAADAAGTFLLVTDTGNNRVRLVNISGSAVNAYGQSVPAGNVLTISGMPANLSNPAGIAMEGDATPEVFVADRNQHRIARIAFSNGAVTTAAGTLGVASYAGDGAAATSANLDSPEGVCLDSAGNLFVSDTGNHAVRAVCLAGSALVIGTGGTQITINPGNIDRIAGGPPPVPNASYNGDNVQGRFAYLNTPTDIFVDSTAVYFCDTQNQRVRYVILSSGIIHTAAGTGSTGFNGDALPPENSDLNMPRGLAMSGSNVYVSDGGNRIVRTFGK